ncbi:hypothetical protein ACRALDRAFT_2101336, partial [Sodiomyces alcalophilus JCM 7366]|uniref:uncharacterized protein n=1 Tax=Sodiomyces alcalophilus JCM 7366 TaxID=591952 RepID=UPI0039B49522
DNKNKISKGYKESLRGYTPTQALIKEFKERGITHYYLNWVIISNRIYKTNRFTIPFINIYSITNIQTTFNIAFALVNKEDFKAYK